MIAMVVGACGGGEDAERAGAAARPIIGGTVAPEDHAVVLLVSYPQDQSTYYTCSAAVIAPRVLVTAAHCVDAATHGGFGFGVFFGEDASAYATVAELLPHLAAVEDVHAHPAYSTTAPFHGDIGVAVLEADAPVAPLPIMRTAVGAEWVGKPARIVGYGQTVVGTYNAVRHQASTVVAAIDADDTVQVGDASARTCVGDSGGPALVTVAGVETVIGVDSYGESGCATAAHFRRVDLYLEFLDGFTGGPAMADAGVSGTPDADGSAGDDDDGGAGGGGGGGCAIAAPGSRRVRRAR